MQKFEYKLIRFTPKEVNNPAELTHLEQQFGIWGNEGWELVKMEPYIRPSNWRHGSNTDGFLAVFKRPKGG